MGTAQAFPIPAVVPRDDDTADLLRGVQESQRKAWGAEQSVSRLVFMRPNLDPFYPPTVTKESQETARALELQPIGPTGYATLSPGSPALEVSP